MMPSDQQSDDLFIPFDPNNLPEQKKAYTGPNYGFGEQANRTLNQNIRNVGRAQQRVGETLAGLPGDIVEVVRSVGSFLPGGIPKEEQLSPMQKMGRSLLESIPTSADLSAQSAERFPQFEPQNEFEQLQDEYVQDVASLALPAKGKIPFARSLGIAASGQIGKQVAKEIGISEAGQDMTKSGVMLFASLFRKGGGLKTLRENAYKNLEESFSPGETLRYDIKQLRPAENIINKGVMTSAKEPAAEILGKIKEKFKDGYMAVEDAIQIDQDINRAIAAAGKDEQKAGFLKQLKKNHLQLVDDYAKQNPTFKEAWQNSKDIYQSLKLGDQIKSYISKNTNLKNLSYAGVLLGLEESFIPGQTAIKLGTLGATAAGLYMGEVARRINNSPALRKYYINVMQAAANENKGALARNLAGLERVAKKEFEQNPFPIFEVTEEEDLD